MCEEPTPVERFVMVLSHEADAGPQEALLVVGFLLLVPVIIKVSCRPTSASAPCERALRLTVIKIRIQP